MINVVSIKQNELKLVAGMQNWSWQAVERKLAWKCLFHVFLWGLAAWSCQDGFAHARQQKQGNKEILTVKNVNSYTIKQTFIKMLLMPVTWIKFVKYTLRGPSFPCSLAFWISTLACCDCFTKGLKNLNKRYQQILLYPDLWDFFLL